MGRCCFDPHASSKMVSWKSFFTDADVQVQPKKRKQTDMHTQNILTGLGDDCHLAKP